MRRSNVLLLDQSDAKTIKVNEEVTLLRWGNIKVRAIDMEGDLVKTIYANYDAQATNFSKTKKFTWLADIVSSLTSMPCLFDGNPRRHEQLESSSNYLASNEPDVGLIPGYPTIGCFW